MAKAPFSLCAASADNGTADSFPSVRRYCSLFRSALAIRYIGCIMKIEGPHMTRTPRHSFLALALTLLVALATLGCSNVDEKDFEAGMQAYAKGDFATALKKWKPLAEDGNVSAQTNLGVMYYQGRGMDAPNYPEALRWYRIAAMQGYPDAQFNLGLAHMEGKGVARDFKVFYRKQPLPGGDYSVDHTAGFYIFDPAGRVRLFAQYGESAQAVLHDVKLQIGRAHV